MNSIYNYERGFIQVCKRSIYKVNKGAKIRNQYNQVPHQTQDTNGKVTNSQLSTINESQEVSPFPAGDHKAQINRHAQRHNKHKTENINDPQMKYPLGTVSKNILLEGLNQFHHSKLSLNSDVDPSFILYASQVWKRSVYVYKR